MSDIPDISTFQYPLGRQIVYVLGGSLDETLTVRTGGVLGYLCDELGLTGRLEAVPTRTEAVSLVLVPGPVRVEILDYHEPFAGAEVTVDVQIGCRLILVGSGPGNATFQAEALGAGLSLAVLLSRPFSVEVAPDQQAAVAFEAAAPESGFKPAEGEDARAVFEQIHEGTVSFPYVTTLPEAEGHLRPAGDLVTVQLDEA